jgi:hypothetical protein
MAVLIQEQKMKPLAVIIYWAHNFHMDYRQVFGNVKGMPKIIWWGLNITGGSNI